MSYASLVNIPEKILGSSTSLAAIASLGVHGLLLAILPVLTFESKSLESTSQRTVGLTELTPAELSRLPQVATSDIILPPFATQQSALPALPPPPPIQPGGLPPLPSYQLPLNYPTVSNNPLRASSPQAKTFRVRASAPTQNKRSLPSVTAFNKTADSVRVQPFIPAQNNRATPPSGIVNTTKFPQNQTYRSGEPLPPLPRWTPPRVSGLPSTNGLDAQPFDPNNFSSTPPAPPAPSQQPGQPTINPPQNISPSQNQQTAANPQSGNRPQNQKTAANPQTQPTPAARSPQGFENTKREILAKRDQLARANRARSQTAPPTLQNTPVRGRQQLEATLQQRLQSQPQSNPASSESKTTVQARQLEEYQAQRQKVQQNHPKAETKQPVRQRITTCDRALDGNVAVVNAVVNPQGKIVEGPTLYTKTGNVDTQSAIARVRNYPFRANSNTVSYDFAIEFKYDTGNCSEPTPEASPGNNQTQQSKS